MDHVNKALGEAEAILDNSQATAKGIAKVSMALIKEHGCVEENNGGETEGRALESSEPPPKSEEHRPNQSLRRQRPSLQRRLPSQRRTKVRLQLKPRKQLRLLKRNQREVLP
ncbi:uncharacterized protein LOC130790659 [Actinidia eriantha]|uniref:uncharacterized protein LOC130790659 n=1 Tax=Actinidia eriantha TaxID=165200 RepID=UPI002590A2D7|nr:uncharacterized protein LOC130790659 [Actinidia eriantha]XP_057507671.1 uncharacterized protein LOC130790659 [Actinidia eriantha]